MTVEEFDFSLFNTYCHSISMESPCFSKENFDRVYEYINAQIGKNPEQEYWIYHSYECHVKDKSAIIMKKGNYTLAIIDRGKGVYSLAKILSDNKKLVSKANDLFCQLVEEAGKV